MRRSKVGAEPHASWLRLTATAGITMLVAAAVMIYAVRGPAILLDLGAVGRFLCL